MPKYTDVQLHEMDLAEKLKLAANRLTTDFDNGNIQCVADSLSALQVYAPVVLLEMSNTMTPTDRQALMKWLVHKLYVDKLPSAATRRILDSLVRLHGEDQEP